MKHPLVTDQQIEYTIKKMPNAFTILDYIVIFKSQYRNIWQKLVECYGLYGSGTRYSALTYLSNRLSSYSRRKEPGLLEPTPVGWRPQESRYLRRTTKKERKSFGSPWIVVFRRRLSK